ncbi:hypothetical protein [Pseudomonas sichuanensis]|uniref:hypothetical protein n=1 Tax=Pseudomonas sichuanensis TaxID=2213015 RepID=UPI00215E8FE6|nr:hypothetical protein [Pseudomonas sichuanensis]UVL91327.1 hypothetical protein LOY51_10780 [Pseudomonas sichuanensis]
MEVGLLFKVILALPLFLVYVFFIWAAVHAGATSPIGFIRHAILVGGLAPLCAWLGVMFFAEDKILPKAIMAALGLTAYHYYLFAVSAHYDGFMYWGVQLVELLALFAFVRFIRKGSN